MTVDEVFAAMRELAEHWKMSAKKTREASNSYRDYAVERENCARKLLEKIFELESVT